MAGKARVHELAKELGKTSKEIMAKLTDMGEFVKSPSSTIEAPVVRKLRDAFPATKPAAKTDLPTNGSAAPRAASPNGGARPSRRTRGRGRQRRTRSRSGRPDRPHRRQHAGRQRAGSDAPPVTSPAPVAARTPAATGRGRHRRPPGPAAAAGRRTAAAPVAPGRPGCPGAPRQSGRARHRFGRPRLPVGTGRPPHRRSAAAGGSGHPSGRQRTGTPAGPPGRWCARRAAAAADG